MIIELDIIIGIQLNPALTDPPPTEFRLLQMQIYGPFIPIYFISFVSSNKVPLQQTDNISPLKSVRAGFHCILNEAKNKFVI